MGRQVVMQVRGARFRSVAVAPVRAWNAFWEVLASGWLARCGSDSETGLWLLLMSSGSADGSWFAGLPDLGRLEDDDQQFGQHDSSTSRT